MEENEGKDKKDKDVKDDINSYIFFLYSFSYSLFLK